MSTGCHSISQRRVSIGEIACLLLNTVVIDLKPDVEIDGFITWHFNGCTSCVTEITDHLPLNVRHALGKVIRSVCDCALRSTAVYRYPMQRWLAVKCCKITIIIIKCTFKRIYYEFLRFYAFPLHFLALCLNWKNNFDINLTCVQKHIAF